MSGIPKYDELRSLSDGELIACYNAETISTIVGTDFYIEELFRRQMVRESARMQELTKTIRNLTWFILALTAFNALLIAFQIWWLR